MIWNTAAALLSLYAAPEPAREPVHEVERAWTILFHGASDNDSEESFVPDYPVIDVGTDPFIKEERYVMRQKRAKVKGWQPDIKWAVENALAQRDRSLIVGAKRTFDLTKLSGGFASWKKRAKKIKADRAAKIRKAYEEHKSTG